MPWKMNRRWRVVMFVLVALVALRLALPYIVTRYVNNVLSELEGYQGTIDEVDIHLIRGAYQIHSLKIFKIDGNEEIPFINIPSAEFSIEWPALLDGAFVGEINFDRPILNFIGEQKDNRVNPREASVSQFGTSVDWNEPIRKLMPLDINRIRVNNGKVTFYNFSSNPNVSLFLQNVQLDALNLDNAKDNSEALPSRIYLQALSIGNGQLNIAMKINVLKEIPDLDMDMRFENVDMKMLNEFLRAYGTVDVEQGNFNLYSELVVSSGEVTGYVKPMFSEMKVVNLEKDKQQVASMVWETMVDFLSDMFKNQRKDQFATRVPVKAEIATVNTSFFPAVWDVFTNAFVKAFESSSRETVSLASVQNPETVANDIEVEKKSKKELRKERRKDKREEKRKAKKERKIKESNEKAQREALKEKS